MRMHAALVCLFAAPASALLATRPVPPTTPAQRARPALMQEAAPPTAAEFEQLRFENLKLKKEVERLLEVTDPRALKSRIQDATELLTPEELKELKLEASANWPPRTKPREGEGYIFFQGPTPKTGTQPGRASFSDDLQTAPERFSALGGVEKAVFAIAAALGLAVFIFLLIPTGPTPTYVVAAPPPAA